MRPPKSGVCRHPQAANQFMTRLTALAAGAVGIDPRNVAIIRPGSAAALAAGSETLTIMPLAAKAVGKPVKVIYSREQHTTELISRARSPIRDARGIDDKGRSSRSTMRFALGRPSAGALPSLRRRSTRRARSTASLGPRSRLLMTACPTIRSAPSNQLAPERHPIGGQLRSVAPGWTFWAVESLIDEVVHATGRFPELRLRHRRRRRQCRRACLANALRVAMGLAGYGTKALPKGAGSGVACASSQERKTSTWTACVAHVAVWDHGAIKVKKLTVASDVGTAVNPDGIRAQVMGRGAPGAPGDDEKGPR